MAERIAGARVTVYVIDTHSLVWYLEGGAKLSPAAREAFDSIDGGAALGVVPTIVLAEVMHLADRRRLAVQIREIIARLQRSANFVIASLDLPTIMLMMPLKTYELHDRAIVATARSYCAAIITKDEHVRRTGAVSCIW